MFIKYLACDRICAVLTIFSNFIITNTYKDVFYHNFICSWDTWGSKLGSFPKRTWQLWKNQDIKVCLISDSKPLITMPCYPATFSWTCLQLMLSCFKANHPTASNLGVLLCKARKRMASSFACLISRGYCEDLMSQYTCSIIIRIIPYKSSKMTDMNMNLDIHIHVHHTSSHCHSLLALQRTDPSQPIPWSSQRVWGSGHFIPLKGKASSCAPACPGIQPAPADPLLSAFHSPALRVWWPPLRGHLALPLLWATIPYSGHHDTWWPYVISLALFIFLALTPTGLERSPHLCQSEWQSDRKHDVRLPFNLFDGFFFLSNVAESL